ncbi:MAG: hypothetical protein MPL62_00165 [Alphaproteobacteria bacterium]|nr:hypothetical protein [Alphaproteobacteria bacterium]
MDTLSDSDKEVDVYRLAMMLPESRPFLVDAFEVSGLKDIDAIIGMDIIIQSRLLIKGHERLLEMFF